MPPPRQPGAPPPALPVILSLKELEFVFDPVTRLRHREFKSRLPGLMGGSLEPAGTRQGGRGHETRSPRPRPSPRGHQKGHLSAQFLPSKFLRSLTEGRGRPDPPQWQRAPIPK